MARSAGRVRPPVEAAGSATALALWGFECCLCPCLQGCSLSLSLSVCKTEQEYLLLSVLCFELPPDILLETL